MAAEVARPPRLGLGEGDQALIVRQAERSAARSAIPGRSRGRSRWWRRPGALRRRGRVRRAGGELGGELHWVLLGVGCGDPAPPCSRRRARTVQSAPGSAASARQSTASCTARRRSPRRRTRPPARRARGPRPVRARTPSRPVEVGVAGGDERDADAGVDHLERLVGARGHGGDHGLAAAAALRRPEPEVPQRAGLRREGDEGLGREVVHRQAPRVGEPVAGGHGDHARLADEDARREPRILGQRQPDEGDVGGPVGESGGGVSPAHRPQRHPHPGVALGKHRGRPGVEPPADGGVEPHDDLARLIARRGAELEQSGVPGLDDRRRPRAQGLAGGGQRDRAVPAAQQLDPKVALQPADALAEGRLGDVDALGRPRHAELLRDGEEVAQVEEVRIHNPRLCEPALDAPAHRRHPRRR